MARKHLRERFAEMEAARALATAETPPPTSAERIVDALAGSLPVDVILADAEAPLPPPALEDDLAWMVHGMPEARKLAFFQGIGNLFAGDPEGTSIYVLNRWARSMSGARYCLNPGPPVRAHVRGRADALVNKCLVTTRSGVERIAVESCGGDLEAGVREAIDSQMREWGLEHGYEASLQQSLGRRQGVGG